MGEDPGPQLEGGSPGRRITGLCLYIVAALNAAFWAYVGWYGMMWGFTPFVVLGPMLLISGFAAFAGYMLRL